MLKKIMNIYNDIARKYGNFTVKDFRKYKKLGYKKNKQKLEINFLNNCKQLGVRPKFLMFKLQNVYNKEALSIRKTLLRSVINKRNNELQRTKLGSMNISKRIKSFIFLNIYGPPQHGFTYIILFVLK